MTGFLAELGRRLAERWFTLLVLPGLAYLLVAAAAVRLGHSDWADWRALWDGFGALTEGKPDRQNALAVRAVLLVVVAVPVSAGLGLLAQALAAPVERALCGDWPRPFAALAARLTARRATAWQEADTAYDEACAAAGGQAAAIAHAARRNAVSLIPPERPTWLGDRLRAPAVRLGQEYGIDLATVWPRLWLLLPAPTRDILTEARTRLDAAFALGGWALLYLPLAAWWWPAAAIALTAAAVARRRASLAAEAYAELVESAVDLHLDRLLTRLAEPRPAPQQGRALTERLRRGL
ncbi:hypothetical protein [Streptomyces aurantiogriseus]|uniref:Vegetative cell wall protein gp1 n=1 Tax=Streptomyces aurantiogriseus TaxID=66870 RepID=A0A918CGJ3_9ACTN|nr:hypothetical protein [Streptomyces aurantiogriseus]GGR20874.1 hypothetical protein GCM10010251_40940 [Streptomyces aurantiogriseus]